MEVSNLLFLRFVDMYGEIHHLNPRHIHNVSTINIGCFEDCEGSMCNCKIKTRVGYGSGYRDEINFTEDIGSVMENISNQLKE